MTSLYCDYIESECFHFNDCDDCKERCRAAAYDFLDYFHFTPEQFLRDSLSGYNDFVINHRSEIYNFMVEISEDRIVPVDLIL